MTKHFMGAKQKCNQLNIYLQTLQGGANDAQYVLRYQYMFNGFSQSSQLLILYQGSNVGSVSNQLLVLYQDSNKFKLCTAGCTSGSTNANFRDHFQNMCEILTIAGLFERENSFFFFKNYFVFPICTVSHVACPATGGWHIWLLQFKTQYFRVNNIQVVQKQVGAGLLCCWEDYVRIC